MNREQLEISIQSNMPTNGVGFITAANTRQVAEDMADYVDTQVEGIDDDLSDIENRLTEVENDVTALEPRVTEVEDDLNTLTHRVDQAETDISNLDNRVTNNTTSINNLDGRITTNTNNINNLNSRVSSVESVIDNIDDRVDDNEDRLDALEPRVTNLESTTTNLSTRVATNESSISSLRTRMTGVEGDIAEIEDEVNENTRDINNLKPRMTAAENNINTLETRVTNYEHTIDDMQTTVDTVEDRMDDLEDDVDTLADNVTNNYYTKTQADAKYEVLANKATDFVTVNDTKYPTTKAVADYAYKLPDGGIPKTDLSEDVLESLDKADTAIQEEDLVNYAKVDGYYEGMAVGTADNLAGQTERTNDAMYRKTGGSEEVASGRATILNIKGQTIAWNQLLQEGKLVDMGLPSGTLWATCNIDVTQPDGFATSPFQYECSFFSWGNIDGHNTISNSAFDYNWGTINAQAPWYEGQPYGDTPGNTLTTSIPIGDTYDAARVNIGTLFCLPTSTQVEELFQNIIYINADGTEVDTTNTDKRVIVNDVRGIYIQSKINGARLFFSCSGYGENTLLRGRTTNGLYWARTYQTSATARGFRFTSDGVTPRLNETRSRGAAMRAVISKSSIIETGKNNHKFALSTNNKTITDVTLTYGSGNEPSTVAQFESDYFKWFGKTLDYEPYDAGSLRSVQLDSLKTTGFNQWDEQWESGTLNPTTGGNAPESRCIRSKNYIQALPNTSYYVGRRVASDGLFCYDENYNFLGRALKSQDISTTLSGTKYVKFRTILNYNTYRNDISINISDTSRNGEYEPYKEHSVSLPVTTITGKLNGEGESVVVFPDGMKSAGTAYDEIYTVGDKTYAVKRIGSVDLGTLNWSYTATWYTFSNTSLDFNTGLTNEISNLKSTYFVTSTPRIVFTDRGKKNYDRIISRRRNSNDVQRGIMALDYTYNTVSEFKAAMQGVILYYELETPLVYELDTFDLPVRYKVDGDGTEEQIQKSGVQGLAAILTCIYGVDAVKILDKLPQNYISEVSMDNFLAQLNTVTGGTWTKTWNENTGEWDFSFTPNAQTNDINTDETI